MAARYGAPLDGFVADFDDETRGTKWKGRDFK